MLIETVRQTRQLLESLEAVVVVQLISTLDRFGGVHKKMWLSRQRILQS